METHRIHPELLERQVRVLVVGCGGTGSAILAGLPYLHQTLVVRGHPGGLQVPSRTAIRSLPPTAFGSPLRGRRSGSIRQSFWLTGSTCFGD